MNTAARSELAHERRNIVSRIRAERAGAERQSVRRIVDDREQPLEVVAAFDDARKTKNRARRIVWVNRHPDVATLGDRNNRAQEILEVGPKPGLVERFILSQQRFEFIGTVARIPARQRDAFREVERFNRACIERERRRAVGEAHL